MLTCTAVVDVRHLQGRLERAPTTFVLDERGTQIWPDEQAVKNVPSQLVDEGLHLYVKSESDLRAFSGVRIVKASQLLKPRHSPNAPYFSDVVLSAADARQFQSAGKFCRLVYLIK